MSRAKTHWRNYAQPQSALIVPSCSYLPPQILPDERQPVPSLQGALQGVGDVEHSIVHQYLDVLGEVASSRIPEGLMQLWKPPAQAAQDLADRVAVLEGLVINFAGTAIAADKFADPGNNLDLHLASSSGGWHIRCGHVQLLSPTAWELAP